ncbi:hypothetical protein D3C78_435190 [compost metagenome]
MQDVQPLRLTDQFAGVVEHRVEQRPPGAAELVGGFRRLALREAGAVLPFADIDAAALHQMVAQLLVQRMVGAAHLLEAGEGLVQQAEQVVVGVLVATVRGGGEQHQMALGVVGQGAQQAVALVLATAEAFGAGMRLVDDYQLGAGVLEFVATAIRLDVVEADYREGVFGEDRGVGRQAALQALDGAGGDHLGADVELALQLLLPLLAQVRRAKHGEALDLTPVEHFPGDQPGLDGLADTHVVGDQQADHLVLQGHQQRHQLIGTGLDVDPPQATEGTGAGAQLEQQGIAQQQRGTLGAALGLGGLRQREGGRLRRLALQQGMDDDHVLIGTAQRAQVQARAVGLGQDDPFASARADDAAGLKLLKRAHSLKSPKMSG